MGRNIGSKNLNKKFRRKNSQKLFDHAKQSATDAFKTASKKKKQTIQETEEATGDLIGKKIWAKITKGLKKSSQNTEEENIGLER